MSSWVSALAAAGAPVDGLPRRSGPGLGVQGVSLGQFAGGFGEISDLAGIDHHYWQGCCGQGRHQRQLQAASGFQQNSSWSQTNQLGNQIFGSGLIVGGPEYSAPLDGRQRRCKLWPRRYRRSKVPEVSCLPPVQSWPGLARCGLGWPRQRFGLY